MHEIRGPAESPIEICSICRNKVKFYGNGVNKSISLNVDFVLNLLHLNRSSASHLYPFLYPNTKKKKNGWISKIYYINKNGNIKDRPLHLDS